MKKKEKNYRFGVIDPHEFRLLYKQANQGMLRVNSPTIRDRLLRVAQRLLGSKEEAEDVAQEVLLKLCQRNDIQSLQNVEAYAVTMAKNLCFDIKRKLGRTRMVELDKASHKLDNHTPETCLESSESYSLIRQTMEQLNDSYKLVIHLRDIEELEYSEISSIMQMTENQVRVTLSRARKKLRDSLLNEQNKEYETSRRAAR